MMANKTKTVTIGAYDIVLEKDFDTTLGQIEGAAKYWTDNKHFGPVTIGADEYYASCYNFDQRKKTLEVSLSRAYDNLPHIKKGNNLPEPMNLDADQEAVGVTYLKFYFAKKICLFVSTKDVSIKAPARFIDWNKKILGSGAEKPLEKFTVQAHLTKDTMDALNKLEQINRIQLHLADLPNQEANELKKGFSFLGIELPHTISFNGTMRYEKGIITKTIIPEIRELLSRKPKTLIVFGSKNKQVNLTNAYFRKTKKITGNLTVFKAFDLMSEVYKEEFEE
jgi:hypothetical protein